MPHEPLPRFADQAREREAWLRKLEAIVSEATAGPALRRRGRRARLVGPRSADDHPARLRGLPAIGPGVGGAVPGTDPVQALLAKKRGGRGR